MMFLLPMPAQSLRTCCHKVTLITGKGPTQVLDLDVHLQVPRVGAHILAAITWVDFAFVDILLVLLYKREES